MVQAPSQTCAAHLTCRDDESGCRSTCALDAHCTPAVTYYCDTTVEASSPAEARRLAMENPDYDNQRSYDDDGENAVEGVCEGDEFDRDNMIGGDA